MKILILFSSRLLAVLCEGVRLQNPSRLDSNEESMKKHLPSIHYYNYACAENKERYCSHMYENSSSVFGTYLIITFAEALPFFW